DIRRQCVEFDLHQFAVPSYEACGAGVLRLSDGLGEIEVLDLPAPARPKLGHRSTSAAARMEVTTCWTERTSAVSRFFAAVQATGSITASMACRSAARSCAGVAAS